MSNLQLVTCAENVRIWDLSNYSLLYEFNHQEATSFCSLAWSYENWFLSVPTEQRQVVISEVVDNDIHNTFLDVDLKVTSACFSQKSSQHVSLGSATGEILYWDIHQKRAIKTVAEVSSGITCLHHNPVDSHVVSGSLNGNIYIHNLNSGVACLPFKTGNGAVRSVQVSSHNKTVLGSTCDGGFLELWDINNHRLYRTFSDKHLAPAMDLKFSPTSNVVLASVGLDKRLLVHDMKDKKLVYNVRCEVPLRSLEFSAEGTTIVVAGSKGLVCVYDLRNVSKAVTVFTAHNTAVQKVAINLPRSDKYSKPSSSKSKNILMPTMKLDANCDNESVPSRTDTGGSDQSSSPALLTDDYSDIPDLRKHVLLKRKSLSPSNNVQKNKSHTSQKSSNVILLKDPSPITDEAMDQADDVQIPDAKNPSNLLSNKENLGLFGSIIEEPEDEKVKQMAQFPTKKSEMGENSQPQPAQVESIRHIVADLVDDLRESLHMDNMNLFMQMFKQFTILQGQVEQLRGQCQANSELLEEVQHLREENKRLKSGC